MGKLFSAPEKDHKINLPSSNEVQFKNGYVAKYTKINGRKNKITDDIIVYSYCEYCNNTLLPSHILLIIRELENQFIPYIQVFSICAVDKGFFWILFLT